MADAQTGFAFDTKKNSVRFFFRAMKVCDESACTNSTETREKGQKKTTPTSEKTNENSAQSFSTRERQGIHSFLHSRYNTLVAVSEKVSRLENTSSKKEVSIIVNG